MDPALEVAPHAVREATRRPIAAATVLLPLHPLPLKAVVAVVVALGPLAVAGLTALGVESRLYQSLCQTLLLRHRPRVLSMDLLLLAR